MMFGAGCCWSLISKPVGVFWLMIGGSGEAAVPLRTWKPADKMIKWLWNWILGKSL